MVQEASYALSKLQTVSTKCFFNFVNGQAAAVRPQPSWVNLTEGEIFSCQKLFNLLTFCTLATKPDTFWTTWVVDPHNPIVHVDQCNCSPGGNEWEIWVSWLQDFLISGKWHMRSLASTNIKLGMIMGLIHKKSFTPATCDYKHSSQRCLKNGIPHGLVLSLISLNIPILNLPYLFIYKSHACISRTPIFNTKNSTKFFFTLFIAIT